MKEVLDAIYRSTDCNEACVHGTTKYIYKKWSMPFRDWGMALYQFSIFYGDLVSL